jgi:MOSC domain-containing protein YiiM
VITTINAVLTGHIAPLTEAGEISAIAKSPVDGPRAVYFVGLEGDQQADLSVHGGRDKAIHHYPRDHYPAWQSLLGPLDVLGDAGAFGENISTHGWTEGEVCIGDRLRLGSALVEISQGRQPCWKQGYRLGEPKAVAHMVQLQMCGWYYRVIEEGVVEAGASLALVDRPFPAWTVKQVIGLLLAGEGKRDKPAMLALASLEVLAENWRARAEKLARQP